MFVPVYILQNNGVMLEGWINAGITQHELRERNKFSLIINERHGLSGDEMLSIKDIWVELVPEGAINAS